MMKELVEQEYFFCNPGASYQKGALEKNHELSVM